MYDTATCTCTRGKNLILQLLILQSYGSNVMFLSLHIQELKSLKERLKEEKEISSSLQVHV